MAFGFIGAMVCSCNQRLLDIILFENGHVVW
jgi:hypothetical protein